MKGKIIRYVDENLTKKKIDIAKKFEIPAGTLAAILKFKDKFSEESGFNLILLARENSTRLKLCEYKDVEECVLKGQNGRIGVPILQKTLSSLQQNWYMQNFVVATGGFKVLKTETGLFLEKMS